MFCVNLHQIKTNNKLVSDKKSFLQTGQLQINWPNSQNLLAKATPNDDNKFLY